MQSYGPVCRVLSTPEARVLRSPCLTLSWRGQRRTLFFFGARYARHARLELVPRESLLGKEAKERNETRSEARDWTDFVDAVTQR